MHNLHLAIIKTKTPKDACSEVESAIEDFGSENNWRTICGCVSLKNKVYDCDEGLYVPTDMGITTIAKINRMVRGWVKNTSIFGKMAKQKLAKTKGKVDLSNWDSIELFSLERFAKHLKERSYLTEKFDIRKLHEFYQYDYTECGVTNLVDESAEGEIYVVFIDMHD